MIVRFHDSCGIGRITSNALPGFYSVAIHLLLHILRYSLYSDKVPTL